MIKRFLSLSLSLVVILTGLNLGMLVIKASGNSDMTGLTFDDIAESERQLWTFSVSDNSSNPKYEIKNVYTNQFLMLNGNEVFAEIKDEINIPEQFSVEKTDEKGVCVIFSTSGKLSVKNNIPVIDNEYSTFVLLSYSDKEATDFRMNGTFYIKNKDGRVLTDHSEAFYTISKNADEYTSSPTQRFQIEKAEIIKGIQYYRFQSITTGRYLTNENGAISLGASRYTNNALWTYNEIKYSDISKECLMPDKYKHYYQISDINGDVLFSDGETGEFRLTSDKKTGPSNLFVFEEGEALKSGLSGRLGTVGGTAGTNDTYSVFCRRFLQAVENNYELSIALRASNLQANQKWELTYLYSEDRAGRWYRSHYYTIKSVEFDLYLTVKNGQLILAERDETDEYQEWRFMCMSWGWTSATSTIEVAPEWENRYTVMNKGAWAGLVGTGKRLSLVKGGNKYVDGEYMGGAAFTVWEPNGDDFDLGHKLGNNSPENMVKRCEVTLRCYASAGLHLQADGPDIPVEGSIKQLYVSNDGNDDNDGLTINTPIKTLDKAISLIKEKTIAKRGHISFRRGDIFEGTLSIENVKGRTNKLIYFDSYGDGASNPKIVSKNNEEALKVVGCYSLSIRDIDFVKTAKGNNVALFNESRSLIIENIGFESQDKDVEAVLNFDNSGNNDNSNCDTNIISNVSIKGGKIGIKVSDGGGMTFRDIKISSSQSSAFDITDSYNNNFQNSYIREVSIDGSPALNIKASSLNISGLTINSVLKGGGIVFTATDNTSSKFSIKDSYFTNINGIALTVSACDKQTDNEGKALYGVDSVVVDNVLFKSNHEYDLFFSGLNLEATNLSCFIGNSTFVFSGSGYYNGFPEGIDGVVLDNNSFITEEEYSLARKEFGLFLKKALAEKKGDTDQLSWEAFQTALVNGVSLYNSEFFTIFTLENNKTELENAMKSLKAAVDKEKPTVTEEAFVEKISVEESIMKMLEQLVKDTADTISLRVNEDFTLSIGMQKLISEAGKSLKISFIDENEEMMYQWFFKELPCTYDIELGVYDNIGENKVATAGQIVSLEHTREFPNGTTLIVMNTVFNQRVNLQLKKLDRNTGEIFVLDTTDDFKQVLMSNDNKYLQLMPQTGGDYVIEAVNRVIEPVEKEELQDDNTAVILIIVSAAVLLIALGVVVAIIKRKKVKGDKK